MSGLVHMSDIACSCGKWLWMLTIGQQGKNANYAV